MQCGTVQYGTVQSGLQYRTYGTVTAQYSAVKAQWSQYQYELSAVVQFSAVQFSAFNVQCLMPNSSVKCRKLDVKCSNWNAVHHSTVQYRTVWCRWYTWWVQYRVVQCQYSQWPQYSTVHWWTRTVHWASKAVHWAKQKTGHSISTVGFCYSIHYASIPVLYPSIH